MLLCNYTQFISLCGQNGHVDKVLEVWNEWSQSTIGRRDNTLHSEVFRGVVMRALSTDPTTVCESCKMFGKATDGLNVTLKEISKQLEEC